MELVLNNQPSTTSEHPYASQIEALLAAGPVTKLTGQAGSIISIYGNVETAKTIAYFSVETVSYGLVDNDQYVDDCECEYCSVEQSTWAESTDTDNESTDTDGHCIGQDEVFEDCTFEEIDRLPANGQSLEDIVKGADERTDFVIGFDVETSKVDGWITANIDMELQSDFKS